MMLNIQIPQRLYYKALEVGLASFAMATLIV